MKKVLFVFVLLLINIKFVKADEWQEEYLEGDNVLVEERYKFYKENIVGDYVLLGEHPDYEYENVNDIIYGEYSSYNNDCIGDMEYDVEYATMYKYKEIIPVRYIKINNLSNNVLDISDIQIITDDNILVMHEFYSCTDCTNDYYSINPGGSLIIEFEYALKLDEFKLILEFSETAKNDSYSLVYSSSFNYYTNELIALVRGNSNTIEYKYDDNFYLYPNYGSVITGYDIDTSGLKKIISEEKVCRRREILSYHYNIVREYFDDNYYRDIEDLMDISDEERNKYIKDLENYKKFYKYIDNSTPIDNNEKKILSNNLDLVKTGIRVDRVNYDYLVLFVLCLMLIGLIIIKYLKMMSNEKDD